MKSFREVNPCWWADARSTYCYLLAAAEHRDEDAWECIYLITSKGNLTIPLPMPQRTQSRQRQFGQTHLVMETVHIQHQCQGLANFLSPKRLEPLPDGNSWSTK